MTVVSVIIGTRNRALRLRECLRYLSHVTHGVPWELVLVDNGSSDDTRDVCASAATIITAPVLVLHEPCVGVANARNRGALAARGDVLLFIDDDCYAAPDLVESVANRFAVHDIGFLGGRVLLHDPDDLPLTIRTDTTEEWFPAGEVVAAGAIHGACVAFRRTTLERTGLFDPHLGPGTPTVAGEDLELIERCALSGWSGLYAPDVVVRHHHGRRLESESWSLALAYSHGRGACYAALLLRGHDARRIVRAWHAGTRGTWRWRGRHELEGGRRYLVSLLRAGRLRPLAPVLPPAPRRFTAPAPPTTSSTTPGSAPPPT